MRASFDLGPGGAVTNEGTGGDVGTVDRDTWRVLCADGAVAVYAVHEGAVTQIAAARLTRHTLDRRRALQGVAVAWSPIVNGLTAVLKVPVQTAGSIKVVGTIGEPTVYQPSWTRRIGVRVIVASSIGLAMFVTLAVLAINSRYNLIGWHRFAVPIVGVATCYAFARGIAILASAEARREPMRDTDGDGKRDLGPIAARGFVLAVFGFMLYLYPVIVLGDALYRYEPGATTVAHEPPPITAPKPAPPPPPPSIETRIATAPSFAAALALATPAFTDGADSAGAWLLARYAKLTWPELQAAAAETTVPLVLKDSALERGKRICAPGTVLDIERKEVDRRPVYAGALATTDGDTVQFIALGSTGSLVKRSSATFCGIATGTAGKSVMAVGMFDLPENQRPAVER